MKNQTKQKILSVDLAQFSHRLRLLAHQESRSMLELCTILDADPTRLHEIYLGLTKPDWKEVHQLANIFQIEPEFLTGKINETIKKLPKASAVVPTQTEDLPILTLGVAPYPIPPSDRVKEEIVPNPETTAVAAALTLVPDGRVNLILSWKVS